jgi:hypothetical protein
MSKVRTIVGVDLGKTTAVCMSDFNGKLIFLGTFKNLRRKELIRIIRRVGKPLIIATDVSPPPRSIRRIASTLGVRIYSPEKTLTLREKEKLVKKFSVLKLSKHEKDAIAACIKAFKKHKRIVSRIRSKLRGSKLNERFEKILEMVILKKVENISEAIKREKRWRK